MKKTIIALFALAGVAAADTYTASTPEKSAATAQGNYYGFTLAPNNDTFLTNNIPSDITELTLDSITLLSRTANATNGNNALNDIRVAVYAYTADSTTGTYLGVSTNSTGTGVTGDTTYTLTFSGITIDPSARYQFLYVKADTTEDLSTFDGYKAAAIQWGTSVTNRWPQKTNADGSPMVDAAGNPVLESIPGGWGTYKSNGINSWEGQYVPVTTVTLSTPVPSIPPSPSVPEPTTATLSLLALAGLAARRRRK